MKRTTWIASALAAMASLWGICLLWAQEPPGQTSPLAPNNTTRVFLGNQPWSGPVYGLVPGQNPQDYERQGKIAGAVVLARDAKDETAKTERTKELLLLLGEEFEARQEARDNEFKELEARLKQLREVHTRRQSEKKAIVEDRARQLLRESAGLGWGDNAAGFQAPTGVFVPRPITYSTQDLNYIEANPTLREERNPVPVRPVERPTEPLR